MAAVVLLSVACGRPQPETRPPNVVLISIDALRADHLSCYGYNRHTSPVLDRLAARGTKFSRAFVNTHGTPPAHATLFSSLYQESHRVGIETTSAGANNLPADLRMIQEYFSAAGWHTLAVTGGGYMSAEFGFSRGFDEYIDRSRSVDQGAGILLEHLRAPVEAGEPVFAFLHTYQVHSPYTPPEDYQRIFGEFEGTVTASSKALLAIQAEAAAVLQKEDFEYLEALYDGEIRYTDEVLGDMLSALDELGFLDNAVVVVTADHGEEFGEHGGLLHGGKLFEELLHVPLIISGTGVARGVVDPTLVSHIDIAPTLLALAGLEIPAAMEGRNIFDQSTTAQWADQRVFAQYGDSLYCVRTPRWKLILRTANQRVRLFDLHRDPGERRDLSSRHPDVAAGLLSELEGWRNRRPRLDLGVRPEVQLSDEKIEELRALGYVD
jgi:arylsulfatase A-like enzyme